MLSFGRMPVIALSIVVLECAWIFTLLKTHFLHSASQYTSQNDLLLHRYAIGHVARNWPDVNPFDHILPLNGGFPLFGHYQHLPHVIVAYLQRLSEGVGIDAYINADTSCLFILSLMPLAVFWGSRRVGLSDPAACFVALLYPILNDKPPPQNMRQGPGYSYGLGINSYLHVGHGLWSQLIAGFLLFPSLGLGFSSISKWLTHSGSYSRLAPESQCADGFAATTFKRISAYGLPAAVSAVAFAATLLSNVFYGYMVGASLTLLTCCTSIVSLRSKKIYHSVLIPFTIFGGTLCIVLLLSSYFVVPFFMNRSAVCDVEHRQWKFDSVGIDWLRLTYMSGDLFDFGMRQAIPTPDRDSQFSFSGFPVITTLSGIGFCAIALIGIANIVRSKLLTTCNAWAFQHTARQKVTYLWIGSGCCFWAVMFAGPTFFGRAFTKFIPFGSSLHFHRFISALQAFGMLAAGVPVDFLYRNVLLTNNGNSRNGASSDTTSFKNKFELEGAKMKLRKKKRAKSEAIAKLQNNSISKLNMTFMSSSMMKHAIYSLVFLFFGSFFWALKTSYNQRAVFQVKVDNFMSHKINQQRSHESQLEYDAIVSALQEMPPGRLFVGMPGYPGWATSLFPRLLEDGFDMLGPTLHTMSPVGSWVEWFDHGNHDHYELFNVKYILMPRNISPAPFLKGIKLAFDTRFFLYSVITEGYGFIARGCESHKLSMKVGRCLHPLFHDARPGRGYGKGAEDVIDVDEDWMYDESITSPPARRPPLTLNQMNRREVLPPSRSHLTRAGKIDAESSKHGGTRFEFSIRMDRTTHVDNTDKKKKSSISNGEALIVKTNWHPHWSCNIRNNTTRLIVDGSQLLRVAPGYFAIPLEHALNQLNVSLDGVVNINVECEYAAPKYKVFLIYVSAIVVLAVSIGTLIKDSY